MIKTYYLVTEECEGCGYRFQSMTIDGVKNHPCPKCDYRTHTWGEVQIVLVDDGVEEESSENEEDTTEESSKNEE